MSPLLRLPSELRNAIYSLVFAEVDKIIPQGRDETNQLKLVCCQLYYETAWLELRYNNSIIFQQDDTQQDMSVKRFAAFAMTIPPKALHFLNIVVLTRADAAMTLDRDVRLAYDSVPEQAMYEAAQQWESPEDLVKIAKFCHAHPIIEVRFVLPGFQFSNTQPDEAALRFLVRGIGWAYLIRRQKLDDAILSHPRLQTWFQLVCANSPLWLHLATEKPMEKLKLLAAISQDVPSAFKAILSTASTAATGTGTGTRTEYA